MATKSLDQRRKIRALEAKRDSLSETKAKATQALAVTRAELKHMRSK
jgi:hypothetical protein